MHAQGFASPGAALVACMQRIAAAGLSQGSSGNASVRDANGMWITPTGVTPARLCADDTVAMDLGVTQVVDGTIGCHAGIARSIFD